MQPLVDYTHSTCPKCSGSISGDSKTCGSCGAVRYLSHIRSIIRVRV